MDVVLLSNPCYRSFELKEQQMHCIICKTVYNFSKWSHLDDHLKT